MIFYSLNKISIFLFTVFKFRNIINIWICMHVCIVHANSERGMNPIVVNGSQFTRISLRLVLLFFVKVLKWRSHSICLGSFWTILQLPLHSVHLAKIVDAFSPLHECFYQIDENDLDRRRTHLYEARECHNLWEASQCAAALRRWTHDQKCIRIRNIEHYTIRIVELDVLFRIR